MQPILIISRIRTLTLSILVFLIVFCLAGCCGSGTNSTTTTNTGGGGTPTPTNRPVFITITPNGKFAYVADAGANSIAQFSIGTNGTLTPLSPAMVTTNISKPDAIAIPFGGQYAYVANQGNNTVALFKIGTTGALTPLSPATVKINGTPSRFALASTQNDAGVKFFLYVGHTNGIAGFQIGTNGSLASVGADTAVGPVADLATGVDLVEGGNTLHILLASSHTVIDAGVDFDGSLNLFSHGFPTGTQPAALVNSQAGTAVFALNQGANSISSYSDNSGDITGLAATIPVGIAPVSGADLEGDGDDALFIVNSGSNTVSEFTYDTISAPTQLLTISTAATGTNPAWVAITPPNQSGFFIYVANQDGTVSQYTINNFGALAPLSPASVKA